MRACRISLCFLLALSLTQNAEARFLSRIILACQSVFRKEERLSPKSVQPIFKQVKFKSIEDLFSSFATGLLPDLSDPDQLRAFDTYLKLRFGVNPQHTPSPHSHQVLSDLLKKHPQLWDQPRFRNMEITISSHPPVPPSAELKETTERLLSVARSTSSQLFQIEANKGSWRKLLQGDPETEIPRTLRALLSDPEASRVEKCKTLAAFLVGRWRLADDAHRKHRPLSQAIADLIHNRALSEPRIEVELKNADARVRIQAMKEILQLRDGFAMELGFADHYSEVLAEMEVPSPKGLKRPNEIEQYIQEFENQIYESSSDENESSNQALVRHLSLVEKPHRSCLGGSDCSSRTYFEFGLGEGVHYFTLTNLQGISSGHMTLVLGRYDWLPLFPNVAFLEKVQNVPTEAILPMLEAIRLSLAEQGISLELPKDVGNNHSSLSNDSSTRVAVERIIKGLPGRARRGFVAHAGSVEFSSRYSRAFDNIERIRFVSPKKDIMIQRREIDLPWRVETLPFDHLIQQTLSLRDGTPTERVKYLAVSNVLIDMGFETEDELFKKMFAWLQDLQLPLRFRGDILLRLLASRMVETTREMNAIAITRSYPHEERVQLFDRLIAKNRLPVSSDRVGYWAGHKDMIRSQLNMWTLSDLMGRAFTLLGHYPDESIKAVLKEVLFRLAADLPVSLRSAWEANIDEGDGNLLGSFTGWTRLDPSPEKKELVRQAVAVIGRVTKSGQTLVSLQECVSNYPELFREVLAAHPDLRAIYESYKDSQRREHHSCFVKGTQIATPMGARSIEQIKVGDLVLSYNNQTQQLTRDRVVRLHRFSEKRQVEVLSFEGGQTTASTPEHPFYSMDRERYVKAAELSVGETVLTLQDGHLNSTRLVGRSVNEEVHEVFNFETEHHHNYFANGVLVHNIKERM